MQGKIEMQQIPSARNWPFQGLIERDRNLDSSASFSSVATACSLHQKLAHGASSDPLEV
jgi:hypothetical protein